MYLPGDVCGSLQDPANGRVHYSSMRMNSRAYYSCDYGYNMMGVRNRMCRPSGWTGDPPNCNRKQALDQTTSSDIKFLNSSHYNYILCSCAMSRTHTSTWWKGCNLTGKCCVFCCYLQLQPRVQESGSHDSALSA